jgi:hypothetical protein
MINNIPIKEYDNAITALTMAKALFCIVFMGLADFNIFEG